MRLATGWKILVFIGLARNEIIIIIIIINNIIIINSSSSCSSSSTSSNSSISNSSSRHGVGAAAGSTVPIVLFINFLKIYSVIFFVFVIISLLHDEKWGINRPYAQKEIVNAHQLINYFKY